MAMFEDTLLIIKPDYLHKRRPVLLKLLSCGFQIEGNRRLNFSPELAAEFYADYADEKGFMLEVILLSKGISEAFILTKENAVKELLNIMICYFGNSSELERNVHVTKHPASVAREIIFIFPNYIHEPIELFDANRFCNRPMIKPLLGEIYDILQNVDCSQKDWKMRVADYLMRRNPVVPQISNQCQVAPDLHTQERSQQTLMTYRSPAKDAKPKEKSVSSGSMLSSTTPHSSLLLTTSSCVTCAGFDHTEPIVSEVDLNKRLEPQSDEPVCVDEEVIWKEIIVYEEIEPEEEEQRLTKEYDFFLVDEDELEQEKESSTSSMCAAPTAKMVGHVSEADDVEAQAEAAAAEEATAPPPAPLVAAEPAAGEATPPPTPEEAAAEQAPPAVDEEAPPLPAAADEEAAPAPAEEAVAEEEIPAAEEAQPAAEEASPAPAAAEESPPAEAAD
ncbi:fibrous sheath CABYR-binding protein [Drosophila grimshawi]|uniref:GH14091 n=1 Tax=Drosophila grimshawi TaxID=7222 RepID=B4JY37_DROGR|nr:fibrous sheath CABYR-binding protein [Drosophila grimshawi]EDV90599.1 GH14091 [Drosophila grimshawi]